MILEQGEYLVYTDGSCRQSIGGWGFVIIKEGQEIHGHGGLLNCTNNQAEMMAAIMALSCFRGDNNLIITTDSKYLCEGMESHIYKWRSNGYKGSNGHSVKNIPLWETLYRLQLDQAPVWEWVRGHNGDRYNEIADDLALRGREYAQALKSNSKVKYKTSLHDFYGINKNRKKSSGFYTEGNPKIDYKDANG